jgi:hypothetical protein
MNTRTTTFEQLCEWLCRIHQAIRAWLGLKNTECGMACDKATQDQKPS